MNETTTGLALIVPQTSECKLSRLTAYKATRFGRVHPTSGKGTIREEKVSMEVFQDLGQSSPYKGHPKDGSISFTIPLRRARANGLRLTRFHRNGNLLSLWPCKGNAVHEL